MRDVTVRAHPRETGGILVITSCPPERLAVKPDLSRHSGVRPSSLVPRTVSRGELQWSGGGIDSAEVALEYLGFISMLAKRVCEAKRRPFGPEPPEALTGWGNGWKE